MAIGGRVQGAAADFGGTAEIARDRSWTLLAVATLVLALALRLWGLTASGLTHPEMYIPGLDLIPGISEPPPRLGFLETLDWHFRSEAHPVGYYLAMWAWTGVAGTSEFGLRLPSVLLGTGCVWLAWRLAGSVFDRRVGAVAALMMAIHGFQMFWSQTARAYVPGEVFALLSTWVLVVWLRSGRRRPGLEAAYAASLVAGTQMLEQFWAVAFLQMVWVALVTPDAARTDFWRALLRPWAVPAFRIAQVQAIALALAAAEFVHLAHLGRHRSEHPAAPRFLVDYLDFGFLFQRNDMPSVYPDVPWLAALALAVVAVGLAIAGVRAGRAPVASHFSPPLAFPRVLLAALAGAALSLFLAAVSARHRALLASFALLPLACLWLPALSASVRPILDRAAPALGRWIDRAPFAVLLLMLALVTPSVLYALSAKLSVLVPRGFLPFTPFYLILIAAGLLQVARGVWVRTAAVVALALLFAGSAVFFQGRSAGPIDYRGTAALIERESKAADIVMVRKRSWADTPLLHYLPHAAYVSEDYAAYLAARRPQRVWLPQWLSQGRVERDDRHQALEAAGYRVAASTRTEGAETALLLRRAE